MRLWNGLGLAALMMIGIGCAPQPSSETTTKTNPDGTTTTTTTGLAKKDLKITMIAKSSNNPVFLSARTGAEAAAKELGDKNGIKITIDWATPPEENGEVQAQRIAQAVNDNADAILISCTDATKVTGAIDDAVGKGVQVMTFDSDAPKSKRFAFYGADDDACGRQVIDELAKVTGEKGNFAILAGTQTAPNLQARVKGAMEEAKKFPNMKFVQTVYHKESPQDASAAVTQAMNANPQIDSWAMIGGWPLFATSLLSLDPAKVKIVAVDALPEELDYVDKGIAPVLLAQPTYNWGYKSVGFIVDKLVLKKDVQPINKMDLTRVSKENLGEWAKQLQDWGFPKVNPKYLAQAPKK